MSRIKVRPKSRTTETMTNGVPQAHAEVLTLAEAASYLRVPETDVVRMVQERNLPGQKIGEQWRFLKAGLQKWLATPPGSSKQALLAMAGKFKDDPFLEEIVQEA